MLMVLGKAADSAGHAVAACTSDRWRPDGYRRDAEHRPGPLL